MLCVSFSSGCRSPCLVSALHRVGQLISTQVSVSRSYEARFTRLHDCCTARKQPGICGYKCYLLYNAHGASRPQNEVRSNIPSLWMHHVTVT